MDVSATSAIRPRRRSWMLAAVISAFLVAISSIPALSATPSTANESMMYIGEPTKTQALFDRVVMPRVEAAQNLIDAIEASPSQGDGLGADDTAIYGYERVEFEEAAIELLNWLAENQPGSFGGGALDPIDPFIYVGHVGDLTEISAAIEAQPIKVEFVKMSTTLAERRAVGERLLERDFESSVGDFEEYVVMEIGAEEILAQGDELIEAIKSAVGVPEKQTSELREALLSAPATGVEIGPLLIIPDEPKVTQYSLSAGVSLQNSSGANSCTSGYGMRRISTGVGYTTTAAHCPPNLKRNGASLGIQAIGSSSGVNKDWKVLNVPAAIGPAVGQVWVSPSTQFAVKGPYRGIWPGNSRCAKGITSGYKCGFVASPVCNGWPATTYKMTYGDSGGPVLYPYATVLAAGIVSGACSNRDIYTSIYQIELGGGSSPRYSVITG